MDATAGFAASVRGVPWLLSERGSADAYPARAWVAMRIAAAHAASGIVSNSQRGDQYWSQTLLRTLPRFIVPNAVSVAEIDAVRPASIPRDVPLVLWVGRLDHGKNPILFAELVERVLRTTPVRAMVCGDGSLREDFARRVRELRIERAVSIEGFRSDAWSLMKVANAVVSTSQHEGHPNAVLEAMAARCPLVLSDIASHRQVADEGTAHFFDVASVEAAAEATRATVAGGDAVQQRVARARARVETWTPADVAARYDDVYKQAVAAHDMRWRLSGTR
jgi:glycosyltransferase involved in cell wall biosynthesis